jgi:hypothetical protein
MTISKPYSDCTVTIIGEEIITWVYFKKFMLILLQN